MIAPIQIWPYYEAPEEFRISNNGGDEDWVAVVEAGFLDDHWVHFLEDGSRFGICCVEEHALDDGRTVLIGCHS